MSSQRITFVFKKYTFSSKNNYITNDLVDSLRDKGCVVDVLVFSGSDCDCDMRSGLGRTLAHRTRSDKRYMKYFVEWLRVQKMLRKYFLESEESIQALVVVGPLSLFWPFYYRLVVKSKISVCVIFDIFPNHQVQAGVIPKILQGSLAFLERNLIRRFSVVTGMSVANKTAITDVYKLDERKVKEFNLWSSRRFFVSRKVIERKCGSSPKSVKIIFGGQVTAGRSLGLAINALTKVRQAGVNIELTIMSSGRGFEKMKSEVELEWISFSHRLNREDYIKYISKFDFGLVATDPSVTLPTFPSKVFDYLASGLRVVCFLEKRSDLDQTLNAPGVVLCNRFNSSQEAVDELCKFLSDPFSSEHVGEIVNVREKFTADAAAERLLEVINGS